MAVDAKANVYLAGNVTDDSREKFGTLTVTKRRVASLINVIRASAPRVSAETRLGWRRSRAEGESCRG